MTQLHPNTHHYTERSRPSSLSQKVLVHNLGDRLEAADFNSPAKIFQSKQHQQQRGFQFENVTPDVSIPGTPGYHDHPTDDYFTSNDEATTPTTPQPQHQHQHQAFTGIDTPTSLSPRESGEKNKEDLDQEEENNKQQQRQQKRPTLNLRNPSSGTIVTSASTSQYRLSSPRIVISSSSSPSTPLSLSRPVSKEDEKQQHESQSSEEDDVDDNATLSSSGDAAINHRRRHDPTPSASTSTSIPSRPSTPSQFLFKKPEYNSKHYQTHFHRLEKEKTLFHGLKRFFKNDKKSKKNKNHPKPLLVSKSTNSSVSDLSFANEFNKDIEGRYGKWGKYFSVSFKSSTLCVCVAN